MRNKRQNRFVYRFKTFFVKPIIVLDNELHYKMFSTANIAEKDFCFVILLFDTDTVANKPQLVFRPWLLVHKGNPHGFNW